MGTEEVVKSEATARAEKRVERAKELLAVQVLCDKLAALWRGREPRPTITQQMVEAASLIEEVVNTGFTIGVRLNKEKGCAIVEVFPPFVTEEK